MLAPLPGTTLIDIGCGNGAMMALLSRHGAAVSGIDLSESGIAFARSADPEVRYQWDGGHIKFFSERTLATMLEEGGFVDLRFRGAGRLPFLWKSLVASARRPAELA